MPSEEMVLRVAIIRFDDRNRYGQNGVPTTILFGGGKLCVVQCKSPHKKNHWAKVRWRRRQHFPRLRRDRLAFFFSQVKVSNSFFDEKSGEGDAAKHRGELVELWGPVGDYENELKAYQWHFGVMPCKYPVPLSWGLTPMGPCGGGEAKSLAGWLEEAGLAAYTAAFQEDEVRLRSNLPQPPPPPLERQRAAPPPPGFICGG